jgi:hypothetical protein|nr:MAG TPA: hypothetical protein [Caudoviricetes sp.]
MLSTKVKEIIENLSCPDLDNTPDNTPVYYEVSIKLSKRKRRKYIKRHGQIPRYIVSGYVELVNVDDKTL